MDIDAEDIRHKYVSARHKEEKEVSLDDVCSVFEYIEGVLSFVWSLVCVG